MTKRLLMVVEARFSVPERGLLLLPPFRLGTTPKPRPTSVVLKRPDGTTQPAGIKFAIEHLNFAPDVWKPGMEPWDEICAVQGVTEAEVPPGTEVWYDESPEGKT